MGSKIKDCCACISQRWIFAWMGFFALFNGYAMRVCLSIAVTQMVVPVEESKELVDNTCFIFEGNHTTNSIKSNKGTFEWSEYTQGIILSAFYWGYSATQIPGGMIAEKFGAKYVLASSIFCAGLCSLLTPFSIWWGGSDALIVVRFALGLSLGAVYPCANIMLSRWIPLGERSKAGSLVFAGAPMGTVFATSVSGLILKHANWPVVFYFYGVIGILWTILFCIFCYNSPRSHPFISDEEAKFLHNELSSHRHKKPPPTPWGQILTSKPVWASCIANIGNGWGFLTMISDLNKYMSSVLKFSIQSNGYLSSLPYLCMWFGSILASWIFDWLIIKDTMSTTNVRKLGVTIASVGPAIFLVAASYAGCDRTAVVIMLTIGMALLGTSLPSVRVNVLDMSPNYSGSLMALTNSLNSITGIFTPYIVGLLTPHQTIEEWRLVFWIVGGVFLVTNLAFLLYASGEVQEWNDPEFLNKRKESKKKHIKEEVILLEDSNVTNEREIKS